MRIVVTGASAPLGLGVVSRFLSQGHDVVGIARHRPDSWSSAARFVSADIRDTSAVTGALSGAEVVVHCAWAQPRSSGSAESEAINLGGTHAVLTAMAASGARRIVFTSSAQIYGHTSAALSGEHREHDPLRPRTADGRQQALIEQMLAESGLEWVSIRSASLVGRSVDNWIRRALARPVFVDGRADRPIQLVHLDDALRMIDRCALDTAIPSGAINLAAPGLVTLREIAGALGRPVLDPGPALTRISGRIPVPTYQERARLVDAPLVNIALAQQKYGFRPAWNARDCIEEIVLSVRGRVSLGTRVFSLPWRLATLGDPPSADVASPDGVTPALVGPRELNGEFDTPIDPRFPTFLATNLSEALPGPFSPSSESVTVRGLRVAGVGVAERLRPGGAVGREIATRMVAVFAHRLYGGITSAHFMAETVPFIDPETVVRNSGFFGPTSASLPIFGAERPPSPHGPLRRFLSVVRHIGVFGINVVGLTAGSAVDTAAYLEDVDLLERRCAGELSELDHTKLNSLILSARDHVIHGWVLSSGAFMLCAAFNVLLRALCGRDTTPAAGEDLASARSVEAVARLVEAARADPAAMEVLSGTGDCLDRLAVVAPDFRAALAEEIELIGHRGPAEVEMSSTSYADDPELLVRMVVKALQVPMPERPAPPTLPVRARLIARLVARQVRDREVRRDKMVRANWVLRALLREYGRRMVHAGAFSDVDDVFYLLVDEVVALPADHSGIRELVARRRAERLELAEVQPPAVFSGAWEPVTAETQFLRDGDSLRGMGVCGGRVQGRVRIVRPETIDELEPGEVLVAQVTDVGYTAAFCYAAAVVTELGGPMSHAAVVAREFGFPCVVDVQGATRVLPPGALIEVDGGTGEIRVLETALPDDVVTTTGSRD